MGSGLRFSELFRERGAMNFAASLRKRDRPDPEHGIRTSTVPGGAIDLNPSHGIRTTAGSANAIGFASR